MLFIVIDKVEFKVCCECLFVMMDKNSVVIILVVGEVICSCDIEYVFC